ncbi:glycosyltransferase [Maribacter aquivivus]|uniref:glycosyltransferase n=1 Tax=Maribacter aquivivus TaxID=228958 RepID=UPI002494F602|nr:glycosyltransferase [Maribacter aquivivus]
MISPAIVIIAYNRKKSLKRLLTSLENANYPNNDITLIISIDKSDSNEDVLELSNDFKWKFGNKRIIYQKQNLGLKKHILKSMSFALEYGSMIMLEDDLYVSPDYYNYACQALAFSSENEKIAGISLYNHQFNVHKQENFTAIEDGYDNWYFQFASSWGQAWNAKQIQYFLNWYNQKQDIDKIIGLPTYVRNWPKKSWLKYFIAYTISKDKFFIYPKISLTTNFGDEGANMDISNTYYQVPLFLGSNKKYNFSTITESNSIYDAYFENLKICKALSLNRNEITIDLYGNKPMNLDKRYLLSPIKFNFKILKSFGRSFKPHDLNIINNIEGSDFFLYDTKINESNNININPYDIIDYNKKTISFTQSFIIFKHNFFQRILILLGK